MAQVDQPRRVRPPLPRLVEQVRILLWMQMFLSVLGSLLTVWDLHSVNSLKLLSTGDAFDRLRRLETHVEAVLLGLVAAAVLLAVCAPLVRRRWPPVHVLAIVTSAGTLAIGVGAALARIGPGTTVFALLYAALAGWILVDLFRGEVLRHQWRAG